MSSPYSGLTTGTFDSLIDTIDHTLLLNRLYSEIYLDSTVLTWFSSSLSCGSQQFFCATFFDTGDSSCLWYPSALSARSLLLFSLHQTVDGTHSKVLHRLPLFFADHSELYSYLLTERESALRAIGNVESCCREINR